MSYFLEPCTSSKNKIKVELNLYNYATNIHLKISIDFDTHNLLKKMI